MKSKLIDPPRRIQIPFAVRTPNSDRKFGEHALLTAVAMLLTLVMTMAVRVSFAEDYIKGRRIQTCFTPRNHAQHVFLTAVCS